MGTPEAGHNSAFQTTGPKNKDTTVAMAQFTEKVKNYRKELLVIGVEFDYICASRTGGRPGDRSVNSFCTSSSGMTATADELRGVGTTSPGGQYEARA